MHRNKIRNERLRRKKKEMACTEKIYVYKKNRV
jgi:hypothetical protein